MLFRARALPGLWSGCPLVRSYQHQIKLYRCIDVSLYHFIYIFVCQHIKIVRSHYINMIISTYHHIIISYMSRWKYLQTCRWVSIEVYMNIRMFATFGKLEEHVGWPLSVLGFRTYSGRNWNLRRKSWRQESRMRNLDMIWCLKSRFTAVPVYQLKEFVMSETCALDNASHHLHVNISTDQYCNSWA